MWLVIVYGEFELSSLSVSDWDGGARTGIHVDGSWCCDWLGAAVAFGLTCSLGYVAWVSSAVWDGSSRAGMCDGSVCPDLCDGVVPFTDFVVVVMMASVSYEDCDGPTRAGMMVGSWCPVVDGCAWLALEVGGSEVWMVHVPSDGDFGEPRTGSLEGSPWAVGEMSMVTGCENGSFPPCAS